MNIFLFHDSKIVDIPKQNYDKMSEELAEYIELFSKFSDDAAPAPEIEINVKGSSPVGESHSLPILIYLYNSKLVMRYM